jgi:hypothetical protein
MKRAWLVVIACSSPATAPPQQPAVATAPADAAVDAAPDAFVDTELEAAPAWVFRMYQTGLARQQSTHETWTLRWTGDRATIVVGQQIAASDGIWMPTGTTVYTGSANAEGGKFALVTGQSKIALECKREKLDVAAANALRKPHPRTGKYKQPCSGDPGRWVPPKTTKLDVLSCKLDGYDVPMPFAPSPGIEYVNVNDDCEQQGGGYRIATEGAVAPVR